MSKFHVMNVDGDDVDRNGSDAVVFVVGDLNEIRCSLDDKVAD